MNVAHAEFQVSEEYPMGCTKCVAYTSLELRNNFWQKLKVKKSWLHL